MDAVKEQKCPACGAPMRFDPAQGLMVCDYCGTTAEIEKKPSPSKPKPGAAAPSSAGKDDMEMEGFDFDSLNDQAVDLNAENLPVYNCRSCGAELIAPAEQISLTCPYCNNNIVLTEKVSGKLRPDGLIPFKIDSKSLPDAVNRFYKDKVLLPRRFFSESTMGKVTGVYVPFWVFSGTISGDLRFVGDKSNSYRKGDYIQTETSHYSLNRGVSVSFENVPVDASGRIDDKLMDSLEPFRMEDSVPFDMRYLAGYTADRFDEPKNTIADRAKKRMYATAESSVIPSAGAGYANIRRSGGSLKNRLTAKYLLLPVYLFSIAYGGKNYEFAVNGQTGKVVGEVPTDSAVSMEYFLKRALIPLIGVLGFFIARYLLGR